MTSEITCAQLAILDGSWQEHPGTLAQFDAGPTRGTVYFSVEVLGDASDLDKLAQQMIETAQINYAGTHGSITLALAQAVRAVNDAFYQRNLNAPRELRRKAGITAVVLRGADVFIAQGGPGMVVHVRGTRLTRYPQTSPWFTTDEPVGDFPTPGAVPIGLRRDYMPDLAYVKLQSGDGIILGTRALANLFSEDELADAVIGKPVDAIAENLEELAGSADLAFIALRTSGEPQVVPELVADETPEPEPSRWQSLVERWRAKDELEKAEATPTSPIEAGLEARSESFEGKESEPVLEEELAIEEETPPAEPTAKELEANRMREEQRSTYYARIKAGFLGARLLATRGLARLGLRVDKRRIGNWVDRTLAGIFRIMARLISMFMPGAPSESPGGTHAKTRPAWNIAALIFPVVILSIGIGSWYQYDRSQERKQAIEFQQMIDKTKATIQLALTATDKNSARTTAQEALKLADNVRKQRPTNADARNVYLQAQDALDQINGVAFLLYIPAFANYADTNAKPSRIVLHYPETYVLDRGMNSIYLYKIDEVGSSVNSAAADATILKPGDRAGDRPLGELIDMVWIDAGRLAAIDRAGAFWQYDPARVAWSARVANDGNKWARVNLAGSFLNNLYLLDPGANQILKYVPTGDAWSASVTYFAPGVTPDVSTVVDIGVDTDLWVLRKDGTVMRFSAGRPVEFSLRDLETPLKDPVAISVPVPGGSIFIADAGNQRIVQFDRNSGKFVRQFKPGGTYRDAFTALKTLAVDEVNKKIFVVNGTQALFSNLP